MHPINKSDIALMNSITPSDITFKMTPTTIDAKFVAPTKMTTKHVIMGKTM
jgi:hypothetical protein